MLPLSTIANLVGKRMVMDDAAQLNQRGNAALRDGDAQTACMLFERACSLDTGQPALLFNLAAARHKTGDLTGAIKALDEALTTDPYFVQAIFQKGVLYQDAGQRHLATAVFRDFLDTVPDTIVADPRFAVTLERARAAVAEDDAALALRIADLPGTCSRRVSASLAHLTGQSPLYRSEPTFLTVPELPSIPFLDREMMPWLGRLEAAWETLRDEALALIAKIDTFVPYVANPPGTPLNQWAGLDHNRDWGAFFLWRHGTRHDDNCTRLPATTALLETLPLLALKGRAPNAFLSRLAPGTTIPAHNGVTNARVTVHLPLIVPDGCRFRVGSETRPWVPGKAWVFDDTINHEAWNDSADPRLILIFDIWNPLLTPSECAHLAAALSSYDAYSGCKRAAGDEL